MKRNSKGYSSKTGCPGSDALLRFLNGQARGEEAEHIERHLARCPMCSDELKGLSILEPAGQLNVIATELNTRIDRRVGLRHSNKQWPWGLRIAASLAILLSLSFFAYLYFSNENAPPTLAENLFEPAVSPEIVTNNEPLAEKLAKNEVQPPAVVKKTAPLQVRAKPSNTFSNEQPSQMKAAKVMHAKPMQAEMDDALAKSELPPHDSTLTIDNLEAKMAAAPASNLKKMVLDQELLSDGKRPTLSKGGETQSLFEAHITKGVANEEIYIMVEEMPLFATREFTTFKDYVLTNLQILPTENRLHGTIYIEFVVEPNGHLTNVQVVKGINPMLDAEVLRVIKSSPPWQPGRQRGVPVRVRLTHQVKIENDSTIN